MLEVALGHGDFDESLFDTLAHALGTATDKDAAVNRVDNVPNQVSLVAHFFLDISAFAASALHNTLDLVLVHSPLAAVNLVDERVADALKHPHLIGAVGLLQAALNKSSERSNTHASPDKEHGSVRVELLGQRVGHQALEHGDVDLGVGLTSSLCVEEAAGLALKVARADAGAQACSPVTRLVNSDGNLNQAVLLEVTHLERLVRVVGEGVEARHELLQRRQELVQRRLRAGESVQELRDGNVRAGANIAESALALGGAQEHENLLLILVGGMLTKDSEERLGRRVRLKISAPSEHITAGRHELARLLVAPDCGPAAGGCAHEGGLVAEETGDQEAVEDVLNNVLAVGSNDANGAADLEVIGLLVGVIGDIQVKVIGALLSTNLCEFARSMDLGGVDVIGRMRLDKLGRLDVCVEAVKGEAANGLFEIRSRRVRQLAIGTHGDARIRRRQGRAADGAGNGLEGDDLVWQIADVGQVDRELIFELEAERLESVVVWQVDMAVIDAFGALSTNQAASAAAAATDKFGSGLAGDALDILGALGNEPGRGTALAGLHRAERLFLVVRLVRVSQRGRGRRGAGLGGDAVAGRGDQLPRRNGLQQGLNHCGRGRCGVCRCGSRGDGRVLLWRVYRSRGRVLA